MRKRACATWVLLGVVLMATAGLAQRGSSGEWHHYAGDHGSTKYSSVDQINAENFGDLEVAWRWLSADVNLEESTSFRPGMLRATPLMVDGVLYVPTGLSQTARTS